MNKERMQHIIDMVHDCLIDNIEPCENEEPITQAEFDEFMDILEGLIDD